MTRRVRQMLFSLSNRHEWLIQLAFFALLPWVTLGRSWRVLQDFFSPISGDYPPFFHVRLRRAKRHLLGIGAVLGALALIYGLGHSRSWPLPMVEIAPVFAAPFLAWILIAPSWWVDLHSARVLPYFRKGEASVPTTAFLSGRDLARNWSRVESLAREQNLEPLSTFGFADDLQGETVLWHAPERALKSLDGLLNSGALPSGSAVEGNLQEIRRALQAGQRLEVPFCFVLRSGNSWSGAELDARQGDFGRWPDD